MSRAQEIAEHVPFLRRGQRRLEQAPGIDLLGFRLPL